MESRRIQRDKEVELTNGSNVESDMSEEEESFSASQDEMICSVSTECNKKDMYDPGCYVD